MKLKAQLIFMISVFFISVLFAFTVISQEKSAENKTDAQKNTSAESDPADNGPGDDYVIEGIRKEREKVPFSHFKHSSTKKGYAVPCTECHHTAKGNEVDTGCSGKDCHGDTKEGKKLALKGAYHKNCIECHLKTNKKNKSDKAPRKCDGCHN
jgi:hypothetical protein